MIVGESREVSHAIIESRCVFHVMLFICFISVRISKDLQRFTKLSEYLSIILPPYQSKTTPDISEDGTKTEDRVGVTTAEIRDFHKAQTGKSITTNNIVNTYPNELENNGFIDKQESKIDKRRNYYFPIVEIPKEQKIKKIVSGSPITNFFQFNKIIPSKYFKEISVNWLEVEITTLKNSLVELDPHATFQFIDENDNEITIEEFVKNYSKQGKLTNYFVMPDFSNNNNDNTDGMKLLYGDDSE